MKKGIYRHYKGNLYELTGIARHSETLEKMVVYKALYGNSETWVRPISMWNEEVLVNGQKVTRFEYVGDSIVAEMSCGAICWRKQNGKIEYLVLFQNGSKTWSFPKGHMEEKETKLDTAKREIFEEIGVKTEVDDRFSATLSYALRNGNIKYVTLFIAKINENIKLVEKEVSKYKWVSSGEAAELLDNDAYAEVLQDAEEYIKNISREND